MNVRVDDRPAGLVLGYGGEPGSMAHQHAPIGPLSLAVDERHGKEGVQHGRIQKRVFDTIAGTEQAAEIGDVARLPVMEFDDQGFFVECFCLGLVNRGMNE